MAVTGTSVAAAATMLAAAAAIFITFVICFYLFLCAKRYRGAAPTIGRAGDRNPDRSRPRFVFAGAGCGGGDGMDEFAIAALPTKQVVSGDPPADCAVCIAEVVPGEAARVLPRCGHAFHVECVDMWLRSHSTCPLCRCAVAEEDGGKAVPPRAPEVGPESPNFPTNVLFFGSQDAVSTRGAAAALAAPAPSVMPPQAVPGPIAGVAAVVEAARVAALRRLLGCGGGATPAPAQQQQQQQQNQDRDLESGLGGNGESSGSPPAKPQ